jgi:flavin-dependent dehydrogenase
MSKKINNIVIVGGGSAGWMTAATLIKVFPNKQITLIESPNIPTVGVGESTLGFINAWLKLLDIKDKDFMKITDATYKLSIRFVDFYKKGAGAFHYPFGSVDTEGNVAKLNDWYFKKFLYPETPNSDYAECMCPIMALVNENKISENLNGSLPSYKFRTDTAYHFNAIKFANWLRTEYSIPKGVKNILAEVKLIDYDDENGINFLQLDNGEKVTADLFIDCTGFRSILLAGALKEPFISLSHVLPNNSAWAAQIPYVDKRREMITYTNCHAINNGWVWTIPLWNRLGTGYVYSDKYISDEDALEEFKEYLRGTGHFDDEMDFHNQGIKFKNIKSRVGIHERIWAKNVAAIGLSAGFIEPLESNGLLSIHEFVMRLVRALNRDPEGYVSQWDKDVYNFACRKYFKDFADFVAMHYSLSHRDDTPYWRDIGSRNYEEDMKIVNRSIDSAFTRAADAKMENFGFGGMSGIPYIASGMNFFPTDINSIYAYNDLSAEDWKERFKTAADNLDKKKAEWKEIVKDCPTMYDYLKENIYDGQD